VTGAVAIALGTGAVVRRRFDRDPTLVIAATLGFVVAPVAAAAAGFLVGAIVRFRRAASSDRDHRAVEAAALEAADLIGLGLAGGLSVAAACRIAGDHCDPTLRPDLERLIAAMSRRGVVPALTDDRGPLSKVSTAIGSAVAAGAPVLPALDAHVRQEHHRRHIERIEAARRLPIRLLVPLALLVLPGFVLIAVGPAVIDSLARLSP
jgi:tight adherence protein C